MTNTQLDTIRIALESRLSELGDGGSREALWIETSPDELDRIQHARERDFAVGNLERNANRIHEVRGAILRIEAGRFGVCAGCDEEIKPKRLAAVPWAALCLACQEGADLEQGTPDKDFAGTLALAV